MTGSGFVAGERVTVRIRPIGRAQFAKVVSAGRTGRFVAVFVRRAVPDCAGYVITAVGSKGSRAALRRIEPPAPCGVDVQP